MPWLSWQPSSKVDQEICAVPSKACDAFNFVMDGIIRVVPIFGDLEAALIASS
jgi:hypothetical protein